MQEAFTASDVQFDILIRASVGEILHRVEVGLNDLKNSPARRVRSKPPSATAQPVQRRRILPAVSVGG